VSFHVLPTSGCYSNHDDKECHPRIVYSTHVTELSAAVSTSPSEGSICQLRHCSTYKTSNCPKPCRSGPAKEHRSKTMESAGQQQFTHLGYEKRTQQSPKGLQAAARHCQAQGQQAALGQQQQGQLLSYHASHGCPAGETNHQTITFAYVLRIRTGTCTGGWWQGIRMLLQPSKRMAVYVARVLVRVDASCRSSMLKRCARSRGHNSVAMMESSWRAAATLWPNDGCSC
jgi:hypothetical protein